MDVPDGTLMFGKMPPTELGRDNVTDGRADGRTGRTDGQTGAWRL